MMVYSQQSSNSKLFTCSFTIGTSDNWGMNVQKSVIVKKIMRCKCHGVSNTHSSSVQSRSRSKMCHLTHKFQRMGLFREWVEHSSHFSSFMVGSVDCAQQLSFGDLQFHGLTCSLTGNKNSNEFKRRSGSATVFTFLETLCLSCIQDAL